MSSLLRRGIFIQICSVSKAAFIMSYFITPRVTPLYYHYSNEPSICDALVMHMFNTSVIPCYHKSVFKPQFIHYTKNAKYAFLLLFSICLFQPTLGPNGIQRFQQPCFILPFSMLETPKGVLWQTEKVQMKCR